MSLHQQRLNAEFARALSECMRQIKDPRYCQLTSVMNVEITKDMKYAKVQVSVYDDDPEKRKQTIEVLNSAQGMLAHEMNDKLKLRRVPHMNFVLDDSIEYSVHISKLLDELNINRD